MEEAPSISAPSTRLQLPASCNPPTPQNPAKQQAWIIFGASGHLGRSCLKAALLHGDVVTAVGFSLRDTPESMTSLGSHLYHSRPAVGQVDAHTAAGPPPETLLGLVCDVRVPSTVNAVIQKSISHWGRVDIILNASGHGLMGAAEDQDEYDIRNQFETNFFGMLNIIEASLTYFRKRPNGAGGRYLIFSSAGAALGTPGMGPYCATKFAVEGLVESMLYEVDTFNIKATLIGLGPARRDEVATPELQRITVFSHFQIKAASEPYQTLTSPAQHTKKVIQWIDGKQSVSAVKTAEMVWQLGHCQFPPLRLFLGTFAVEIVRDSLKTVIEEMEDWKHLHYDVEEGLEKEEDGMKTEPDREKIGKKRKGKGKGKKVVEKDDPDEVMHDYSDDDAQEGEGEAEDDRFTDHGHNEDESDQDGE